MLETQVQSLGREDPLEKAMAIHSSTLAWKIPWMEEPRRLQSMGSKRVGQDWATSLSLPLSLRVFVIYWNSNVNEHFALLFAKPGNPNLGDTLNGHWGTERNTDLLKNTQEETSLAVQCLRLCVPVQGAQVWSLIRELRSKIAHVSGYSQKS